MSIHDPKSVGLRPKRRTAVRIESENLVSARPLLAGGPTPLLLTPEVDGVNALSWVTANRDMVRRRTVEHRAVLLRGFTVRDVAEFEQVLQAVGGELLEYSFASTPRTRVAGGIYTSTEYPASQEIPLHNEMSYSRRWPMMLGFHSVTSAPEGGETPLANSGRVLERIPAAIRDRFAEKEVMYVRNYGQGLDLSWQDGFKTTDRAAVEDFCSRSGIAYEWRGSDGLRTRQVCQALATHPVTGEAVWFNQAHLFHISSLNAEMQGTLLDAFGEAGLPRNCYYGDGSPIDPADLDTVRQVFREESIAFPWQDGDILLLENMLAAHGRRPFSGPRKLVVGMNGSGSSEGQER